MGASESKQYAKRQSERYATLLAQYQVTGNATEDQRRAYRLSRESEVWDTSGTPYNICNPLWERVRQLDPGNPKYAKAQAALCETQAKRLEEPARSQMWARAEELLAETIRLGDPDFDRFVHERWAAAVIAQGPHRKAEQLAILQRAERIERHMREDRKDAVAAKQKADWAKAIEYYRIAYRKSGEFEDNYEIAVCLVNWRSLNDNGAVQACKDAVIKSKAKSPEREDTSDEADQYRDRQRTLLEMVHAAPHYQAALRLEQQNDLDGAIEAGYRAWRAYDSWTTRDLQSQLLLKAARWTEGSRVLRSGFQRGALYPDHTMRLAFFYFKEQRYKIAIWEIEGQQRRERIPEEKMALYRTKEREYYTVQQREIQTALSTLQDPSTSAAELAKIARFFHFEREFTHSVTALRRVMEMGSIKDADAHGSLADALWASKARDEALEHYKRALELDPNNIQAFIWRCRTGPIPEAAEYWADVVKWDPCAQHFGSIGLEFNTYNPGLSSGSIPAWQADEALTMALKLEPDHQDAPKWRDKLQRIKALVERTKQEQALRAAGKDPLDNKVKANWYHSNRAYGVVGSTNQYTLQYAPGGPLNPYN